MIEIRPILNREQWLAWRRQVLTASDIGAIAGVDPHKTPLRVYAEKTQFVDETPDNPQMRRGRNAEPMVLEYLREDHPTWTITRPFQFFVDVDLKLGCTPDAFAIDDDGLLVNIQIKTVAAREFAKWDGQVPRHYMLQTVCENMLVKADRGILVAYVFSEFGSEPIVEFDVPRHDAAEKRILDEVRQFWDNVKAGVAPKPNYDQDGELLAQRYPPDPEAEPLDLTADNRIHEVLDERCRHKDVIKTLEATCKALDAEIVDKLAGAEIAVTDRWKITRKMAHRDEYVVAAADYPSLRINPLKEQRP